MSTPSPLTMNLGLTGMVPRRTGNGHVPVSPGEIAASAVRCVKVERPLATFGEALALMGLKA